MLCFQLNALQEFFKVFYAILRIPGVHCLKVVVRLHLDQVPWIEPGGKVHILTNIQCLFNKTLGVFLCSQRNDFSFKLLYLSCYFFPPHCCSVTQSYLTLRPQGLQHTWLPSLSPSPGVCSNSCPLSQWCHPTISFPSPPAFNLSQYQGLFQWASGGQSTGALASSSVLPVNIQGWFPLGLTGLISVLSKGTLKSFLQHHSSKALILWCSYLPKSSFPALISVHDYWKNHNFDYTDICRQSNVSAF